MSDERYSQFASATSFLLAQEWAVNDGGLSRKISGAQIGAAWGLDFLGSTVLASGAHETEWVTFEYPPGSGIAATRDWLMTFVRIRSYGGTPDSAGDIASIQVNDDTGANYWSHHLYFESGAWSPVPMADATLIRLAESNSRQSRNVIITINNLANQTKTFNIKNQTGTGSASVVGSVNIAGGEWVNAVDQINKMRLVNAGLNNMGTGSGLMVLGKNF